MSTEAMQAVWKVLEPFDLQPAAVFNPRLPGREYPAQKNILALAGEGCGPVPGDDDSIAYAPVTALSSWIRGGALSSRRLTDIYLSRIERIAPSLKCFITVTADLARAEAARMDEELAAGRHRGWLHGIPYGLKDVFDTAGIRTTWGCGLYEKRIPEHDATIVTMLRQAGAVLLGKVATAELANGYKWFGGECCSPWNSQEPAGGSSSGAASATAAGLCAFTIGTDSLGSILNPADRCGVVGLRATFGRVPVTGGMPLTPSLERIGPLTRTVEDAAIVLAAINGPDPHSASSIEMGFDYRARENLQGIRIGYSPKWFEKIGFGSDLAVPVSTAQKQTLAVLEDLGATLVQTSLPALPYESLIGLLPVEAATIFDGLSRENLLDQLCNQGWFSWPELFRTARAMSAVDYLTLDRFRRQVMLAMDEVFTQVDALIAPTYGSFDLVYVTNFTGHPGLTLRVGFTESPTRSITMSLDDPNGPKHTVPQNVAIHGRLFEEGRILAIARLLEKRFNVWQQRPPTG